MVRGRPAYLVTRGRLESRGTLACQALRDPVDTGVRLVHQVWRESQDL